MGTDINQHLKEAKAKHKEHKKFLSELRKKPPKDLDYEVLEVHEQVFKEIDCLSCANCCKTTGPLFEKKDIERIGKFLKIKPKDFEAKYLRIDEDGDWVLKQVPCVFLSEDNTCQIYDVRPKACREYPHTDRKKIYQINDLTLQNILICPAAFAFVEKLQAKLKV